MQFYFEQSLINELIAFRENVGNADGGWFSEQGFSVYSMLIGGYGHKYSAELDDGVIMLDKEKIKEVCLSMEFLESVFPQSVITHILLNCRGLDDLIKWRSLSDQEMKSITREGNYGA